MKKVALCINCKNELYQLKQTLASNLKKLDDASYIVLLDYQSNNNELADYILTNFQKEAISNKLKFYSLVTDQKLSYSSAYAKNVAHLLADDADVLFNLDPDNFITDDTLNDLRNLSENYLLVPRIGSDINNTFGRIGYGKKTFMALNGYDEDVTRPEAIVENFIRKALKLDYCIQSSTTCGVSIPPTQQNSDSVNTTPPAIDYPNTYGNAVCKNIFGQVKVVGIKNL